VKDKSVKFKKTRAHSDAYVEHLRGRVGGDECKVQFILWADGTWLDVAGIHKGEPVFRPAICAWEAWKAAWSLRNP
jgi:hypothetical protein